MQPDQTVADHAAVDPQVVMVRQFCAHDIGKCSQPELQHGAVRYQPGHIGPDLPGCFVGRDRWELD